MLWEQTQFTDCSASFQEKLLFRVFLTPQKPPSLQSPCLHAQTFADDHCVHSSSPSREIKTLRWYPLGRQGAAAASSGVENRLLDRARRKMPSLGLISLLCLINLKLLQMYLHLITVNHLREYHSASNKLPLKFSALDLIWQNPLSPGVIGPTLRLYFSLMPFKPQHEATPPHFHSSSLCHHSGGVFS